MSFSHTQPMDYEPASAAPASQQSCSTAPSASAATLRAHLISQLFGVGRPSRCRGPQRPKRLQKRLRRALQGPARTPASAPQSARWSWGVWPTTSTLSPQRRVTGTVLGRACILGGVGATGCPLLMHQVSAQRNPVCLPACCPVSWNAAAQSRCSAADGSQAGAQSQRRPQEWGSMAGVIQNVR